MSRGLRQLCMCKKKQVFVAQVGRLDVIVERAGTKSCDIVSAVRSDTNKYWMNAPGRAASTARSDCE